MRESNLRREETTLR